MSSARFIRRSITFVAFAAAFLCARLAFAVEGEAGQVGFAIASPASPVSGGSSDQQLFTGAYQYAYPIEIPPGFAGIEPNIALRYTSGTGNSWIGAGWDLSFGSIQRSTKNGPPRYDDSDTFVVAMGGQAQELVKIADGSYRAKIEGAFQRFTRSGDTWTLQDKMGNKFLFGTHAGWRTGSAGGTFLWALEHAEDRNGNYYEVSYRADGGVLYPDTVVYGGSNGRTLDRKVTFTLEPRPDSFTSWRGRFKQTTSFRLARIETAILVNGVWDPVRTYAISYAVPSGKVRCAPTAITVTGRDGSSTITLSPTRFAYASSPAGWSTQALSSQFQLPVDVLADWRDNGVRFLELDGDGRTDIIQSIGSLRKAFLNTPSKWLPAPAWETGMPDILTNYASVRDNGVRIVDLDGDGLSDLVQSLNHNGLSFKHAWRNTGSGWSNVDATWNLPSAPQETFIAVSKDNTASTGNNAFSRDNGVQFADMNGDGRADLVQSFYIQDLNAGVNRIHLNTGSGWSAPLSWTVPEWLTIQRPGSQASRPNGAALIDINGDGLSDLLQWIVLEGGGQQARTYLNTGAGWENVSSTWTLPDWLQRVSTSGSVRDNGVQFADVNGDGLTDWLQSIKERCSGAVRQRVFLNTGSGWQASSGWTFPGYFTEPATPYVADGKEFTCSEYLTRSTGYVFLDVNADGVGDVVRSLAGGDGGDYVGLGAARPEVMSEVQLPAGGRTVLTFAAASGGSTSHRLPFPYNVISRIENHDGRGGVVPMTFAYAGGLFDPVSREFLGFAKVESRDSEGNKTVQTFHQRVDASGQAVPQAALKGRPWMTQRFDSSGRLLSEERSSWSWMEWAPGIAFPFLSQTRRQTFASSAANDVTTESNFSYDTSAPGRGYGNLIRAEHKGDPAMAGDEIVEEIDYAENAGSYLGGFPKSRRLKTSAGALLSETQTYYDGSTVLGSIVKGNPTQRWERLDKPAVRWIVTEASYNAAGQLTSSKDARGATTTFSFDSRGFQNGTENELGHAVATVIDPRTGALMEKTDANGQRTVWRFDPLGRVIKEIGPLDTEALPTAEFSYNDQLLGSPNAQRVDVNVRNEHGQTDTFWTSNYYDGLGRTYRSDREETGGLAVITMTEFDGRSLARRVSLPFLNTASPQIQWSETGYDGLGRPTRMARPDGTVVTTVYDGKITTVEDERGRLHRSESDAWGRVIRRWEPGVGNPTTYGYDAAGRLVQVTDARGAKTTFSFDSFGRKISMSDPNAGTWAYVYDLNGNLTEQTDARGVKLALRYDALNRLLERKLAADPNAKTGQPVGTVLASFAYDETIDRPTSKGLLTSVSDPSGFTAFYHDRLGRVAKESRTVDGVRFDLTRTFDARGRLRRLVYPSDGRVDYVYNAAGQLDRITDGGATLHAVFPTHDSLGRSTKIEFSNGKVRTLAGYDALKSTLATLRTESMATGSAVALQNFSYGFDLSGNLTSINDGLNPANSQSFGYDALDRISTAHGFYGDQAFAYDDAGNLRAKGAQILAYGDAARPNLLTGTSSGALGVDGSTLFARDFEAIEPDVSGSSVPMTAGYRGNALNFDGVDDVFTSTAIAAQAPTQFTFMAWVRPTAYPVSGFATVLTKSTSAAVGSLTSGMRLLLDSTGKAVFEMGRAGAPLSFTSVSAIPLNKWTFLCASFDGGKARIFVNAYQQSSRLQTWVAAPNGASLTVGASLNGSGVVASATAFKGPIDDPRFQARAWSVSEIEDLYDAYRAGWSFSADANGNLQSKTNGTTTWKYTFDADGRLSKVTENDAARASFVYDAGGRRVKKTTSQGTLLSIGDLYEQRPSGDRVDHVYAGGQLICDIVRGSAGTKTVYYHPDHLGSLNVATDAGGNKIQELTYGPFGEAITSDGSSPARHRYTGQEEDPETGLYYYNARYYDPTVGRFISADDIVPSPSDPQMWNRFAYVRNSPTSMTDPSGNSPAFLGALIGGISGAIQGYEFARSRGYEWYRPETMGYMQLGGILGAASGGAGGMIYANGGFMAGTKGIVVSSFLYSTAMSIAFGDGPDPTIGIGAASYRLSSGEFGYLGKDGNSVLQNVAYGFGALANYQDLKAGFNGTDVSVNAAAVSKRALYSHSSITNSDESINVSVGPGWDTGGKLDVIKGGPGALWNNHVGESGLWSIRLYNVNGDTLKAVTEAIYRSSTVTGDELRWSLIGNSCVNNASKALLRAGVPTLPINFHPYVLNAQLAIRQAGIAYAPFALGEK